MYTAPAAARPVPRPRPLRHPGGSTEGRGRPSSTLLRLPWQLLGPAMDVQCYQLLGSVMLIQHNKQCAGRESVEQRQH